MENKEVAVQHAQTNTLRLLEKSQEVSFKLKLLNISRMIGLTVPPEMEEINSVVLFLKKYYGFYSEEQIITAFELYCAGKLNMKDSHFNTFNLAFIGKVINSYMEYDKSRPRASNEATSLLNEPSPTDDEGCFNWIAEFWKKNNFFPITAPYMNAFRYLKPIISITDEEKNEMKQRVKRMLIVKMDITPYEAIKRDKEINERVVDECKREIVKKHINAIS